MASLDKPPLGTTTVKWRFPEIHPEGRKYVAIAAAIAFLSLFVFDFITWPLVFLNSPRSSYISGEALHTDAVRKLQESAARFARAKAERDEAVKYWRDSFARPPRKPVSEPTH